VDVKRDCFCGALRFVGDGGAEISFGAHLVWLQLPRLLRSFMGFQTATTNGGACRDIVGSVRSAPLEGFVACEDMPAGDQDLPRDRLKGAIIRVAVSDSSVVLVDETSELVAAADLPAGRIVLFARARAGRA
jgi:hypothetical protein